ncbi:hypothetical protein EBH_0039710 [Eimeria brunetti]|uniref:Uncharacterized protein n=1 Tax=Eimeria brunetti TaxID=51314 RepID=U6LLC2_9EIME|nr:hypothetical protein EBH_0039710 [Eimeria brunetti]
MPEFHTAFQENTTPSAELAFAAKELPAVRLLAVQSGNLGARSRPAPHFPSAALAALASVAAVLVLVLFCWRLYKGRGDPGLRSRRLASSDDDDDSDRLCIVSDVSDLSDLSDDEGEGELSRVPDPSSVPDGEESRLPLKKRWSARAAGTGKGGTGDGGGLPQQQEQQQQHLPKPAAAEGRIPTAPDPRRQGHPGLLAYPAGSASLLPQVQLRRLPPVGGSPLLLSLLLQGRDDAGTVDAGASETRPASLQEAQGETRGVEQQQHQLQPQQYQGLLHHQEGPSWQQTLLLPTPLQQQGQQPLSQQQQQQFLVQQQGQEQSPIQQQQQQYLLQQQQQHYLFLQQQQQHLFEQQQQQQQHLSEQQQQQQHLIELRRPQYFLQQQQNLQQLVQLQGQQRPMQQQERQEAQEEGLGQQQDKEKQEGRAEPKVKEDSQQQQRQHGSPSADPALEDEWIAPESPKPEAPQPSTSQPAAVDIRVTRGRAAAARAAAVAAASKGTAHGPFPAGIGKSLEAPTTSSSQEPGSSGGVGAAAAGAAAKASARPPLSAFESKLTLVPATPDLTVEGAVESHPYVRLPMRRPDAPPSPYLVDMRLALRGWHYRRNPLLMLRKVHDLLSRKALVVAEMRTLARAATVLIAHSIRHQHYDLSRHSSSRAMERLGLRFLILDSVVSSLISLGQSREGPYWDAFTRSVSHTFPRKVTVGRNPGRTVIYSCWAQEISLAIQKLKTGERPPPADLIKIKRMLFSSDCSPPFFRRPEFEPWREDDRGSASGSHRS